MISNAIKNLDYDWLIKNETDSIRKKHLIELYFDSMRIDKHNAERSNEKMQRDLYLFTKGLR